MSIARNVFRYFTAMRTTRNQDAVDRSSLKPTSRPNPADKPSSTASQGQYPQHQSSSAPTARVHSPQHRQFNENTDINQAVAVAPSYTRCDVPPYPAADVSQNQAYFAPGSGTSYSMNPAIPHTASTPTHGGTKNSGGSYSGVAEPSGGAIGFEVS